MALKSPEKKDRSDKNENKNKSHSDKSRSNDTEENNKKAIPGKLASHHYKTNKDLKLRRRLIPALKQAQELYGKRLSSQIPAGIPISTMTTYFPQYLPSYTYPVMEWSNLPVQNSVYSNPTIPIVIDPTPILATNAICPYVSGFVPSAVLPLPIAQSSTIDESLSTYMFEETPATSSYVYEPSSYCNEPIASSSFEHLDDRIYYELTGAHEPKAEHPPEANQQNMGLESYLMLPKNLFPSPRTLALDPNPLIDEFCKIKDIKSHVPWLLDLEFGIPKLPITRPIPTYNVKFNSIHCKNAMDAIHPGFESCNEDFKTVILFHYDCVVSSWYRGYIIINCDKSVENFQSWLLLPMQALGLCWL